jgi:hypothetical protein
MQQELQLKSIALVPLAALVMLTISPSRDWVRPSLDAQLGWDSRRGFHFALKVAVELPFGLGFSPPLPIGRIVSE